MGQSQGVFCAGDRSLAPLKWQRAQRWIGAGSPAISCYTNIVPSIWRCICSRTCGWRKSPRARQSLLRTTPRASNPIIMQTMCCKAGEHENEAPSLWAHLRSNLRTWMEDATALEQVHHCQGPIPRYITAARSTSAQARNLSPNENEQSSTLCWLRRTHGLLTSCLHFSIRARREFTHFSVKLMED